MTANPETRESLILRLPTAADAQAWREFIELYEPLVIRFAKRRGLQDADAREIAQNVFLSVAKSVERWQPNADRGRFRAWLFRIARNHLINWFIKHANHKRNLTLDQSGIIEPLDPSLPLHDAIEMDYRREMFRVAAAQARASFSDSSWNAFWRTSVLDEPVETVAQSLHMSAGAVYIARSRIIAKIRSIIEIWEKDNAI